MADDTKKTYPLWVSRGHGMGDILVENEDEENYVRNEAASNKKAAQDATKPPGDPIEIEPGKTFDGLTMLVDPKEIKTSTTTIKSEAMKAAEGDLPSNADKAAIGGDDAVADASATIPTVVKDPDAAPADPPASPKSKKS